LTAMRERDLNWAKVAREQTKFQYSKHIWTKKGAEVRKRRKLLNPVQNTPGGTVKEWKSPFWGIIQSCPKGGGETQKMQDWKQS